MDSKRIERQGETEAGETQLELEADSEAADQAKALHTAKAQIQMRFAGGSAARSEGIHDAAATGVEGASTELPHGDRIQDSFGHHDVSGIAAHVGGPAAEASETMGAAAFATGSDVGFASSPDVRTAAHEAAHVVQQRGGVQLKGGVGEVGDGYEQNADAAADKVVKGESAEPLLDTVASPGAGNAPRGAVQRTVSIPTATGYGRKRFEEMQSFFGGGKQTSKEDKEESEETSEKKVSSPEKKVSSPEKQSSPKKRQRRRKRRNFKSEREDPRRMRGQKRRSFRKRRSESRKDPRPPEQQTTKVKPKSEPVKEPVKESIKEPVIEPIKEPVIEPVKEPVIEPVKEPVKEEESEKESVKVEKTGFSNEEVELLNKHGLKNKAPANLWKLGFRDSGKMVELQKKKLLIVAFSLVKKYKYSVENAIKAVEAWGKNAKKVATKKLTNDMVGRLLAANVSWPLLKSILNCYGGVDYCFKVQALGYKWDELEVIFQMGSPLEIQEIEKYRSHGMTDPALMHKLYNHHVSAERTGRLVALGYKEPDKILELRTVDLGQLEKHKDEIPAFESLGFDVEEALKMIGGGTKVKELEQHRKDIEQYRDAYFTDLEEIFELLEAKVPGADAKAYSEADFDKAEDVVKLYEAKISPTLAKEYENANVEDAGDMASLKSAGVQPADFALYEKAGFAKVIDVVALASDNVGADLAGEYLKLGVTLVSEITWLVASGGTPEKIKAFLDYGFPLDTTKLLSTMEISPEVADQLGAKKLTPRQLALIKPGWFSESYGDKQAKESTSSKSYESKDKSLGGKTGLLRSHWVWPSQLKDPKTDAPLALAKIEEDLQPFVKIGCTRMEATFFKNVGVSPQDVIDLGGREKAIEYVGAQDYTGKPEFVDAPSTITGRKDRPGMGDFVDTSLDKSAKTESSSGAIKTVDKLTYQFGVKDDKKVKGKFTGWFAPDVKADPKGGLHRGTVSGIPTVKPEFAKRSVAMYELDKILNADVIPPTYFAQHGGKQGFIMEHAEGPSGLDDPSLRKTTEGKRALSKLYLLDEIAGQVDRHPGNFKFVVGSNGKVAGIKGIDNDWTFGKDYDIEKYSKGSHRFRKFHRTPGKMHVDIEHDASKDKASVDWDFIDKVIDAAANKEEIIRKALEPLLSKVEVDATIKRLKQLAVHLIKMKKTYK